MLRFATALAALLVSSPLWAQSAQPKPKPSICQAIARTVPPGMGVRYASAETAPQAAALGPYEVAIRFDSHSTYLIESAAGVRVATDFAGYLLRDDRVPTIVTMNRAHSSHYTDNPDPKIKHALDGWGDTPTGGDPAAHHVTVEDVTVRNVTTDILRYGSVPNGNSIFIVEVAGLCIGHLGHIHHMPTESHFTAIGRLDVVMVPIDGGLTLSHVGMRDILSRLRSRIVLPMHLRAVDALPRFLDHMEGVAVERPRASRLVVSARTLPKQPTIVILPELR